MDCRLLKQCSWTYSSQSNQTEPGKDEAPPVKQTAINKVGNIYYADIIY